MKTDLNLLLECLKYQMDNPFSQKEALVTIHSVCQQNSNAGIYFREIGGLMFIKNLAKSSEHSMVKEAALYTLGAIAEQNVYCQQTLCTSELFEDLIGFLSNNDSSTNLKRMTVYVILVLVSNNPQVQKYFVSVGGLDILSQVLVQLESDSYSESDAVSSAKLAVVVTKTVDACIADNPTFGVVLSKYHIVSKLLALLLHESLDSGEKFSIILTLGHCTEDCEENQYDLFKNNGLPLMIQALTDSQNEELSKAATFVLHNCKKITEKLSLGEYSFGENEVKQLKDINMKEKTLGDFWKKAKEILYRIEQLEREGNEDKEKIQGETHNDNVSSMNINILDTLKHLHADSIGGGPKTEDKDTNKSRKPQSCGSRGVISTAGIDENRMKNLLKTANPVNACYRESGKKKTLDKTNSDCNQNLHEETITEKRNFLSHSSDHDFKHPAPIVKNRKQQLPVTDPFTLCSDIINKEVISFLAADNCSKLLKYRCSGCIAVGKTLNSRNFSKLLHACPYQCDRHKVIVEAEDRYKSELRKSLICNKKILLTPRRRQLSNESTTSGRIKKRRIRKNFTKEEINYLFSGVKKMGNHWNSILWSFPFQQGRKAVDLAHKYHRLIKHPKYVSP
ncbi:Telomere repeats-binding bouquet formation protein 1 [Galemys pyrenaicus]|uniref:Telomere repeats-binding bouquet formation protein 1 n=1 Tax=Galemys pyrenaicus TaxID=202257 RepID=A0A8J6AIP6_GALPY|nr:Telomere repeats-binding bouquet formation protein 1 [Galemys pyrenaicus]